MLKDSLIIDPTFSQFNEMLAFAKRELPDLLQPYDDKFLESDRSKWNKDLMNEELVAIRNNFSEMRIEHLKKVIGVVFASEIKKAKEAASSKAKQQQQKTDQKANIRKTSFTQIADSSKKIEDIMHSIYKNKKYNSSDIEKLERAARELLRATKNYLENIK